MSLSLDDKGVEEIYGGTERIWVVVELDLSVAVVVCESDGGGR